ncbi:MAG: hypothetical protein HPY76_02890 [Anaerolineae bacterium]|nr:hypothetical protein [Anaerolineae bacterium]
MSNYNDPLYVTSLVIGAVVSTLTLVVVIMLAVREKSTGGVVAAHHIPGSSR